MIREYTSNYMPIKWKPVRTGQILRKVQFPKTEPGRNRQDEETRFWASLVAQMVKNLLALQETWVWSLGWEDHLENPMDRGAWQATVHGVTKSQTRLSMQATDKHSFSLHQLGSSDARMRLKELWKNSESLTIYIFLLTLLLFMIRMHVYVCV